MSSTSLTPFPVCCANSRTCNCRIVLAERAMFVWPAGCILNRPKGVMPNATKRTLAIAPKRPTWKVMSNRLQFARKWCTVWKNIRSLMLVALFGNASRESSQLYNNQMVPVLALRKMIVLRDNSYTGKWQNSRLSVIITNALWSLKALSKWCFLNTEPIKTYTMFVRQITRNVY